MILKEITNKSEWEGFLEKVKEKTFLQSWNWGELQKMLGDRIWRFGLYDRELVSVVLVVKVAARRGTFLFLPHGPAGEKKRKEVMEILVSHLKDLARREKAGFIRIAPVWDRNEENLKIFKDLGFRQSPIHVHPEETWELNLSLTEKDLLMQLRKTTRYLIRQAEKNQEVGISQSNKEGDIGIFDRLHQETVKRHDFVPFSFDYLKKEFAVFNPDDQISVFFGRYRDEIVASAIVVFWQKMAFYHHGASSQKYPKVPVSYLLQWEAIKEAKRRGCLLYNFWGIAPEGSSRKHPWAGLTLFKKGFGGFSKKYVKTQDLVLSSSYWFNWAIEKIRYKKRGF